MEKKSIPVTNYNNDFNGCSNPLETLTTLDKSIKFNIFVEFKFNIINIRQGYF